jgi:glycosyltransferase involved in cell wall biosynthesis
LKNGVTAVVANYNHGRFFVDCLEGMMKQAQKPETIVVVDDCSTDDSVELILEALGEMKERKVTGDNLKRVRQTTLNGVNIQLVEHEKNAGPSGARNTAIAMFMPQTRFFAMCDCDDVYLPDKIEVSLDAMQLNPEVAVVYTDLIEWNMENETFNTIFHRSFDYNLHVRRNLVCSGSVVRAEAFSIVGPYDPELRLAEDYDMWMKIGEVAGLYHVPVPGYLYRISGNNLTKQEGKDKWQTALKRVHANRLTRAKARGIAA